MKKRFLSIVLAVLMLVSVLPISALAADVEPPIAETGVSTKTSGNTIGPKLEKSAQWVDEKAGIAKITIKVTGEQPTETAKKTDIVLVIDRSLSMTQNNRDWLENAKKAAKAFAKKVLTGDPNVRIAVVAYAAKTINDWDFSSTLKTVENNIDAINTNNVYYNGQWYADHDSWRSEDWHGTNIQAGIHSARERFKSTGNKDADKFMIVLADGEPNHRFGIFNGKSTWQLTSQQAAAHHIKTDYRESGKQYFPNLYTADSTTFSYNNDDIMDADSGYCYTATVSEAYAAKATDGITCYAIGYGIASGSSLINTLMYSISSTDAGFVNAGTDENAITKVFSDIATDIQYKAHDVKLTDTMGAGFTYLSNETYQPSPAVTPSADNKTVTWDVADKLGNETKTLTFYVQYDKKNLTDAETLLTNTSASLSYEDNKGTVQPDITVASPAIENLAKKVTYVDENNTAYTDPAHQEKPHWYGDTVTLAPAPTKEGYTFNGWTTDDVTIGENDTFEMPKQNVTLKASWIKNEPTTMDITITKIWDDSVSIDRYRSAKIWLCANGEQVKSFYARQSAGITKKTSDTTFEKLPVKDASGNDIRYTVKEIEINDQAVTSDNQLVTEDEIWTGAVTGDAKTGFTVTNSVRKNERYGVEVTKTATRDRILANGTTDTVALATTGDKVRVGDVIHYTVTIKNTGNVAFGAGDRGQDNFTAVGTLIGEDGNIEAESMETSRAFPRWNPVRALQSITRIRYYRAMKKGAELQIMHPPKLKLVRAWMTR